MGMRSVVFIVAIIATASLAGCGASFRNMEAHPSSAELRDAFEMSHRHLQNNDPEIAQCKDSMKYAGKVTLTCAKKCEPDCISATWKQRVESMTDEDRQEYYN